MRATPLVPAPGRHRGDLCPGAFRPWPADDGLLVRLRLIGGRVPVSALERLVQASTAYADGRVHLTRRANLQVRALPADPDTPGQVRADALAALASTGLLPAPSHELVRNVMVSPATGLAGGRADLRPVADRLDTLLVADAGLARLPGRFLFVLDDGRGDLLAHDGGRACDLGLVVLDDATAQLRIGEAWGPVLPLAEAPEALVGLARAFLAARGEGPEAPWHVRELSAPLVPARAADPRLPSASAPLAYGPVPGGHHLAVPEGVLDAGVLAHLVDSWPGARGVVVTPWRGLLVPGADR